MKEATLCFIVEGDPVRRVLLGMKKRGFGAGKYNGFGGKVNRGESIREAAVREVEEEASLRIDPDSLRAAGTVTFFFPAEPDFDHHVHLFLAPKWESEPQESEEMSPAWFDVDRIPHDRMWEDDAHWLPLVLAGKRIRARFTFASDNETPVDWEIADADGRPRAREIGVSPGIYPTGPLNAITDVEGVRVGHYTLIDGDDVRTGATAIAPHPGNVFAEKVPAGLAIENGYGKLIGATQLTELGEIETPIVLTNTLAAPRAADAIIDWTLDRHENGAVRSLNPIVGETNDGFLNAIERRVLTAAMIRKAIEEAADGPVEEGSVGGGTGTISCGWKAGIGTSSRKLPEEAGGFTIGVLVQANFPGRLRILGRPIEKENAPEAGSIVIVIATDAPLSDRNLTRLAHRSFAGLAMTGTSMANGSGDYAIAFSTAPSVRRTPERRRDVSRIDTVPNRLMDPLFQAVIEATEEAIYNSLFRAETMSGRDGRTVEAVPVDRLIPILFNCS